MKTLMTDTALPDVCTADELDNGALPTLAVLSQAHLDQNEAVLGYRRIADRAIIAEKILAAADLTQVSHTSGIGDFRQYH